jgi:hypothetical protein
MAHVLFVSVTQTFRRDDTLTDLAPWVARAWAQLTPAKAETCDRVVAVCQKEPVGAWRLRGAYYTGETWGKDSKRRVALSLGDPLPILSQYHNPPELRRGWADDDRDVPPLRPERDESRTREPLAAAIDAVAAQLAGHRHEVIDQLTTASGIDEIQRRFAALAWFRNLGHSVDDRPTELTETGRPQWRCRRCGHDLQLDSAGRWASSSGTGRCPYEGASW